MTDVHDKKTRSKNMSRIKGKDTRPEIKLRKYLFALGYRYRLHDKKLPGKPDLVLKKYNTVIFVHGCFWHGHKGCKYFIMPKTNTEWWRNKIYNTIDRDQKHRSQLQAMGWNVITVWECQSKKDIFEEIIKNI